VELKESKATITQPWSSSR